MKERLVEDWLTKVNERGFEIPFCQILLAKGQRIIRAGHSPYEDGKDIVTVSGSETVNAFQLKGGDVSLAEFEKYYPQVLALVESAVSHPNLPGTKRHKPFFVTTGEIKEPVKNRVKNLNAAWKGRKLGPLNLIEGSQLHADFMELSSDFWPIEPPDVRGLLSLYTATGQSDLQPRELSDFLRGILSSPDGKPLKASRRIASANLFVSYVLKEFYRTQDHWSVAQGWVLSAAHIAWIAEKQSLAPAMWRDSFDLALKAAKEALQNLSEEALKPDALSSRGLELNEITRARATITCGIVAANQLIARPKDSVIFGRTVDLVVQQNRHGQMWLWGESAVPSFLLCFWLLELGAPSGLEEVMLCSLIDAIAHKNKHRSIDPLPDSSCHPDKVLLDVFEILRERKTKTQKQANESSSLESLVLLASRRLLRQNLAARWHAISHTHLYRFEPNQACDLLLWHCDSGREHAGWFDVPQSWKRLSEQARARCDKRLPQAILDHPDFAVLFLLVYPHRLSPPLLKFLDDYFLHVQ